MASGIHSLITRLISPLARPIRYWTVVELITLKSAWFVGCSRFLRLIRWRLFLSPFLRVSYVCTRTSWWKTLQTLLTKKSAGCYTGKSRFWFPTLILSFSARSWGRESVFCQTIWCVKRWKSHCWWHGRSTTHVRIHECCWQPGIRQAVKSLSG